MALELVGRDIVVGIGIGVRPDRVGAAVTAFAHDPAVTLTAAVVVPAEAIERLVLGPARVRRNNRYCITAGIGVLFSRIRL